MRRRLPELRSGFVPFFHVLEAGFFHYLPDLRFGCFDFHEGEHIAEDPRRVDAHILVADEKVCPSFLEFRRPGLEKFDRPRYAELPGHGIFVDWHLFGFVRDVQQLFFVGLTQLIH